MFFKCEDGSRSLYIQLRTTTRQINIDQCPANEMEDQCESQAHLFRYRWELLFTDFERVTMGVRLPQFKDVHFSIATTTKDRIVESDSIEYSLRNAEADAKSRGRSDWLAKNTVVKKGKRVGNSWTGYEIQARNASQKNGAESHEFAFSSLGESKNPRCPVLELELPSGVFKSRRSGIQPSITDAKAVWLWEQFLNSIRQFEKADTVTDKEALTQ